jgi:predicted amidohydrolase/GNAT superfamily N-acetyltransferase
MAESKKVELRNLRMEDYMQLRSSMIQAYEDWPHDYWKESQIQKLLEIFPEGQIAVLVNEKVVGTALSIIINSKKLSERHTYLQVTGNYSFSTHDPDGDLLYGIEIFVHPSYRGMRLGRRLYEARKELCETLNLRSILFGGRIPNYKEYADQLSPREYIEKVKNKEIYDPTLTFQLSNDFHVRKIIKGYMPGDQQSKDYGTLLEWNNVYYEPEENPINTTKSVIRLGLVQWQMRSFADLDILSEQIEYFIDAVSDYQSDFILFPEFFNAPLMAAYNHLAEADAIRQLASYTEALKSRFSNFAIKYNVNIITGSMPMMRGNDLYNVGFLCRRDGTTEMYEKIHITPSEKSAWGMSGGEKVQVFDTDCGKIGILICYDVEFPELPRMLADQGMQILFVPFLTDTQNGYTRVRYCAQARAIENECYVAIAGCVGNLPKVNNMDINYAQSAVFTPSDFAFPNNGVKAEATPNTEMTLIADVDIDLLKELHAHGSVQNLKDRRNDLYRLERVNKINGKESSSPPVKLTTGKK